MKPIRKLQRVDQSNDLLAFEVERVYSQAPPQYTTLIFCGLEGAGTRKPAGRVAGGPEMAKAPPKRGLIARRRAEFAFTPLHGRPW